MRPTCQHTRHDRRARRTIAHRVERVHEQVEHDLLKLDPIAQYRRQARSDFDRNPAPTQEGVAEQVRRRAVFTSDCTIDKLSELLVDNPRGILCTVDEFESWLGQHEALSRDCGLLGRAEWMRLYDGGPHQVDRIKRGSFFVKNWGASELTATTPAALTRLASKLPTDCLFQRFMVFAVQGMRDRDPGAASFIAVGIGTSAITQLDFAPAPEPATLALLGLGLAGLAASRRCKAH